MSAISNASERMAETVRLLERGINVMFLAAGIVVIPCVVALIAAFTFAVLHNGNDFNFGDGSGRGGHSGDVIVLPAQPF
jgi:hypothetical protein